MTGGKDGFKELKNNEAFNFNNLVRRIKAQERHDVMMDPSELKIEMDGKTMPKLLKNRYSHSSIVYQERLYLIFGKNDTKYHQDIEYMHINAPTKFYTL